MRASATAAHSAGRGLGARLAVGLFVDIVQPVLDRQWPGLVYSAGLIGHGSDVLMMDDDLSRDHDWGPRCLIFLAEEQPENVRRATTAPGSGAVDDWMRTLQATIRDELLSCMGDSYGGFALSHRGGLPSVQVTQLSHYLRDYLGESSLVLLYGVESGAGDADDMVISTWLQVPQQKLRTLAHPHIFHDGDGSLLALQRRLSGGFPRQVRLFMQISSWITIGKHQNFVGRCGHAGDELGSRLAAAQCARAVMSLCFSLAPGASCFAPYGKWLGSAFATLSCGGADMTLQSLQDYLQLATDGGVWMQRQAALALCYEELGRLTELSGYIPGVLAAADNDRNANTRSILARSPAVEG